MPFLSLRPDDVESMLKELGLESLDALFSHLPPELLKKDFDLPEGGAQSVVEKHMASCADRNLHAGRAACFLGAGAYDHYCPPVVREILGRGEFYTAYTPYQPEIAQGILQALFEYQTMMARLTGLEIANASLYDGATAALEAVFLAVRQTRRTRIVVDATLHPAWREVLLTGASGLELEVVEVDTGPLAEERTLSALADAVDDKTACVLVPNPDCFGRMADLSVLSDTVRAAGALFVAAVSPLSLALFASGAESGVDVMCGEAREFGIPMSFGGPGLGFLCCSKKLVRRVPGRLVGMTVDANGERAFTLTLQTREQHIRREKATSNICTNQSLCAFAAGIYLAAMGSEGIKRAAGACLTQVADLRKKLAALSGVEVFPGTYWREFVFRTPLSAADVCRKMSAKKILAGLPLGELVGPRTQGVFRAMETPAGCTDRDILTAVTEMRTPDEIDAFVSSLSNVLQGRP